MGRQGNLFSGREIVNNVGAVRVLKDCFVFISGPAYFFYIIKNFIAQNYHEETRTPQVAVLQNFINIIDCNESIGLIFIDHLILVTANDEGSCLRDLYLALSKVQEIFNNDLCVDHDVCSALGSFCGDLSESLILAFPSLSFEETFDQLLGTSAYIIDNNLPENIQDSSLYFGNALLKAYAIGSKRVQEDSTFIPNNIRASSREICLEMLKDYVVEHKIVVNKRPVCLVIVRPSSSKPCASDVDNALVFERLYLGQGGKQEFFSRRKEYSIVMVDGCRKALFENQGDDLESFVLESCERRTKNGTPTVKVTIIQPELNKIEEISTSYYDSLKK